jgi:hypothetical protein
MHDMTITMMRLLTDQQVLNHSSSDAARLAQALSHLRP